MDQVTQLSFSHSFTKSRGYHPLARAGMHQTEVKSTRLIVHLGYLA